MGLVRDEILGARALSEHEIIRVLHEAQRNLATHPSTWAERVVAADLARYDRVGPRALDRIALTAAVLDSPDRPAPSDVDGGIDARINPLAAYVEGRPFYDGATTTLESHHSFIAGRHVALWVDPLVSVAAPRDRDNTAKLRLQSGGARFEFGNLALELARDYEQFAQSPVAATVLSANAPALDAVKLTNDRPARLPFFGWLGPMRGTLLVADLGPHQNFPHAKLAAWKVSILPHPDFEWGVTVESESGGNGAPGATFFDRVLDLFPPVNGVRNLISNGSGNTNFSNKFAGMDVRIRIPRAWGLDVYADGSLDDFDARRFSSTFLQDGGIVGGFTLSCLLECGKFRVRAEYQQTGIRFYTHTDFHTGYAENGEILGDALGPRGLGGYVTLDGDTERFGTVSLQGAYEVYGGNLYGSSSPAPNDRSFKFVQIGHRPGEHRARALLSWTPTRRDAHVAWHASLGAERVTDFAFVAGHDRMNALALIGVELRP